MNVPLEILIPAAVSAFCLLVLNFTKAYRIGYLEGQLKAEKERYESMYQAFNKNIADRDRAWAAAAGWPLTHYSPSNFNVASRSDLGMPPLPGSPTWRLGP